MRTSSIARPGVSIRRGADRHQTNLAQRMTAGTGIRHSEKNDRPAVNPDADRPLDLIQMWVVPDEPEVAPGYEQLELDPSDLQGHLAVVASGMTRHHDQAAIRIRNRYAGRLTAAGERRLAAAEPSEVLIWEMHAGLEGM